MSGTCDVQHREILGFNDAVEMSVDKIQPRRRPPMAEQARLDMLPFQRLFQQWIVEQINLSDGEIVCRSPVGMDPLCHLGAQRLIRLRRQIHGFPFSGFDYP